MGRENGGRHAPAQAATGAALAAGAALAYGVTIVLNRTVAKAGVGVATALGVRFAVAAVVLFALLGARRAPLLPAPGERAAAVLLGAVGYAFEAALFYLALARGTAAAVALLFYAYPAMVTVAELALGWERRRSRTLWALALSLGGTALVVAAGGRVSITTAGVVLALGSAASFSAYLLTSSRLVRRTDAMTLGAWVAAGAGASLVVGAAALGLLEDPGRHWAALVANGAATAAAFGLMFAALGRLGATRTSVVMTLEAVFGIVLAAVFLDEAVRPLQALGGGAVLAGAGLVGLARRTPVEV